MNVLCSLLGTSLLTAGLLFFLYSTIPPVAWIGIFSFLAGLFVLAEVARVKVVKHGLMGYFPQFLNEYMTRTDLVDLFVTKLRENGAVAKMIRLMIIKWVDLSREEIVEVLSGVWPGFEELSREGILLNFAPSWFKRLYYPGKIAETVDRIGLERPSIIVPTVNSTITRDSLHDVFPIRNKPRHELTPLLLWLAENRIRQSLREGIPVIRDHLMKASIPAICLILLWRRVPSSRNPLRVLIALLIGAYVVSLSKGLPASSEAFFKLLRIPLYRKRGHRPFRTDQYTGSVKALLYAVVEPFLPIVNDNTSSISRLNKNPIPNSPAFSQASTLDQTVIL